MLYDTSTQQSLLLSLTPTHIARGEKQGTYLFWMDDEVTLWDRYGRTPAQTLPELTY